MDKLKQHIQDNLQDLDIDTPKEGLWNAISEGIGQAESIDPLKEHIEQYKDELDLQIPGEQSGSNIAASLSSQKSVITLNTKKTGWYVAAASLVLFIVVGALLYNNRKPSNSKGDELVKTPSKTELSVPKLLPDDTMKEIARQPVNGKDDKEQVKQTPEEIRPLDKNEYAGLKRIAVQKATNKKLPSIILETQAEYDNLIAGQLSMIQSIPMYGEPAGDFEWFINDFKRLDNQEKRLRSIVLQKGMEATTLDELGMIYQKKLTVLKMLQREINNASINSRSETDTIPVF